MKRKEIDYSGYRNLFSEEERAEYKAEKQKNRTPSKRWLKTFIPACLFAFFATGQLNSAIFEFGFADNSTGRIAALITAVIFAIPAVILLVISLKTKREDDEE